MPFLHLGLLIIGMPLLYSRLSSWQVQGPRACQSLHDAIIIVVPSKSRFGGVGSESVFD